MELEVSGGCGVGRSEAGRCHMRVYKMDERLRLPQLA